MEISCLIFITLGRAVRTNISLTGGGLLACSRAEISLWLSLRLCVFA
jgi:hypothetical protein